MKINLTHLNWPLRRLLLCMQLWKVDFTAQQPRDIIFQQKSMKVLKLVILHISSTHRQQRFCGIILGLVKNRDLALCSPEFRYMSIFLDGVILIKYCKKYYFHENHVKVTWFDHSWKMWKEKDAAKVYFYCRYYCS